MIGVEIVDANQDKGAGAPPLPSHFLARRIQNECLRRGLII